MPTVSVKLAEEVKSRLDRLAEQRGMTPHAVMVEAIKSEIDRQEAHGDFVQSALQSYAEMVSSGQAYDGDEVLDYMRSRLNGKPTKRPQAKALSKLFHAVG